MGREIICCWFYIHQIQELLTFTKKSNLVYYMYIFLLYHLLIYITCNDFVSISRPNSILVYNCSSGSINKVTWGCVERYAIPLILRHPSHEIFRYPNGSFTNSKIWNYLSVMLYHHIPAYFLDLVSVLTGRKPR